MKIQKIDDEIKKITQELINHGTVYDLDFLEKIYHKDLKFIRVSRSNHIQLLNKEDNMAFFKELKNSGAPPLNDHAEFHYADNDGERGYIILTRRMKQIHEEQEFLFNIEWKKFNGNWKVVRETVLVR